MLAKTRAGCSGGPPSHRAATNPFVLPSLRCNMLPTPLTDLLSRPPRSMHVRRARETLKLVLNVAVVSLVDP